MHCTAGTVTGGFYNRRHLLVEVSMLIHAYDKFENFFLY